jgi:hypothetical protein
MIKLVIALVLVAHGIGHSMGMLGVFKLATVNPSWQGDSWILSGVLGTPMSQVIGVVLWSVALVGFVALAAVVMGWLPEAWWQPLAVASVVASVLGIAVFPSAFPTFSTLGALAVDLVVLLAATWASWVPSELGA